MNIISIPRLEQRLNDGAEGRGIVFIGKANTSHLGACVLTYTNPWSSTVWGC